MFSGGFKQSVVTIEAAIGVVHAAQVIPAAVETSGSVETALDIDQIWCCTDQLLHYVHQLLVS